MVQDRDNATWVRTETSIVIERRPELVFAFVCDPHNDTQWLGHIPDTRQLTPGAMGVGAQFRQTSIFLGVSVDSDWEVTEYIPSRSMKGKSVAGPFEFFRGYTCEPADSATRITKFVEVSLSGPLAMLPRSVADGMLSSSAQRALTRLKKVLERDSA